MIEFRIQEKTRSLNESFRGDWRPRAAAAKRQRTKAMQACPKWPGGPLLVVRLTRVSPGTLDSEDNLRGAMKHVRDGVASRLKVDDASPLVDWQYHQAKGEAEVVVQIWSAGGGVAPPLPVGRPVERKRHPADGRPVLSRLKGNERTKEVLRRLKAGEPVYGNPLAVVAADAGKRLSVVREPGTGRRRAPRPSYTPPRSKPVDAANEAEGTFAPSSPMLGDDWEPKP